MIRYILCRIRQNTDRGSLYVSKAYIEATPADKFIRSTHIKLHHGIMHQLNHFMYSSKENGKQAYNQASKHAHDLIFQTQSTTLQVTPQVAPQVELSEKAISILEFCKVPRTRTEIQEFIGISDREHFRTSILAPLLESGLILMTIPDKPKSSKQKYVRSNHQ